MKKNGKQKTKKNLNNFEITVLNDSCWNDSVKTTAFHNLFIMINKRFCLKLFCLKFFLKKNQFDVKTNLVKKKSVKPGGEGNSAKGPLSKVIEVE